MSDIFWPSKYSNLIYDHLIVYSVTEMGENCAICIWKAGCDRKSLWNPTGHNVTSTGHGINDKIESVQGSKTIKTDSSSRQGQHCRGLQLRTENNIWNRTDAYGRGCSQRLSIQIWLVISQERIAGNILLLYASIVFGKMRRRISHEEEGVTLGNAQ